MYEISDLTEIKILELKELEFEDQSHTYRVNGVVIPSVSTLMEPLSAERYKGISEGTLEKAANKGTSVHNAIENYLKFGIEDYLPEHKPFFEGFLDWWNEKDRTLVASELRVYHKLMLYGGTLDILHITDGLLTLTDVKTTYSISDTSCRVQLEAYAQALASHGVKIDKKDILHLTPRGRGKPIDYYKTQDAEAWRVFGSLKCVHDYISHNK